MKKYKMFNKGAPEKEKLDFAEYPRGNWNDSGRGSEPSTNESPADLRVASNKKDSFHASNDNPNQIPPAHYYPQSASNGQHYDRYHISQGELSDKVGMSDPSSNSSWSNAYDRHQKAGGSSQVSNEMHTRLKQRVGSGSQMSSEGDSNEYWQNSSASESSSVMKLSLGEIGGISRYVSQGSVMPDMHPLPTVESSSVPIMPTLNTGGEGELNLDMQPELTITNAFSLSAEMWDTGQDEKPQEEEPVVSENKDSEHNANEELTNSDQNPERKSEVVDSEGFDLSKVKKEVEEGPFSCSNCKMVAPDSASLQEHMKTHAPKKAKVYLHQCSVPGCEFSTNVIREFISHYSNNHEGLTSYICRWCKGDMNSLSTFLEHVKENFVVPWVKCPHCHLKKKNKSEVVDHISKEHPGESQRVIAGSMFLCRSSGHSKDKDPKIMSESHKTLVSLLNNQKYILNAANRNGKDNIASILDPNQPGRGYQCPDCIFSTTNAQVFLAHIKICESMKTATKQRNINFECKECSFATSSREAFLNHSHVKASLMNGMKRAPYKKRPVEVRNELIRKKIMNIKKQTLALKMKKDREAMEIGAASQSGGKESGGSHFKFSCPYCSEKFPKLNRMKFHIFLSHREFYSHTFPLHQCLSCHMKSSSEEIVRQHIERTHFGRKSGILLINEPPEIIPRKYKTPPDPNKKLVKSIAPIIKENPSGPNGETKKPSERCSSWGRSQAYEEFKQMKSGEVPGHETNPKPADAGLLSGVDKEAPQISPKSDALSSEQSAKSEPVANGEKQEDDIGAVAPVPKNLAMEIVKFSAGDHFTEYIQCPRCTYQSYSVMGFYGHIKRHLDLVVHISTRRKYEFHKPKSARNGQKTGDAAEGTEAESKTEGGDVVEGTNESDAGPKTDVVKVAASTEGPSILKPEDELSQDTFDEPDMKEALSPMPPAYPKIKSPEPPHSDPPPKLESIIINKKSENLIDKDEYSKLGGSILDAKLSSLYTSNGQVKECNICDYMADFPCYIHRHLLSAHLNIHFWECGYCCYRRLERHKVVRHCVNHHTNREPYAKWLGIPDWEKKLAACIKKGEKTLPDHDVPNDAENKTATTDSSSSYNKKSPSADIQTETETTPKDEKPEVMEKVLIEKLPGNLFKCGKCTMCSIEVTQVVRHMRYQHKVEGYLPGVELESAMSEASAMAIQKPAIISPKSSSKLQKPATPSKSSKTPVQSPASTPSTTTPPTYSPILKKSPADQADTKKSESKTKPKKKVAPITIPKTPYRCVFCNYVNMSATEVKKHMWREHSDELNNVGILLKSKEEGEKASQSSTKAPKSSAKAKKESKEDEGLNTQKVPPIKRKLKRTYRPHKRKKTKTYSKCVKEPSKKKSLAKTGDLVTTDISPKWGKKKPLNQDPMKQEGPSLEVPIEDPTSKRSTADINNESPVMPKKRKIQSTQHSDYEWESPSLVEPLSSKSERIYKSVERTESYFEKFPPEKDPPSLKIKISTISNVPLTQENYTTEQIESGVTDNLTMPVFRKAEMDIYKRYIFKTYDGMFLCNYCLTSMANEIEARHHILQVHPKKPTNPLEQPCKTFQLFRKKTRRPEIIVPHAAQPRVSQKPDEPVKKKGVAKKKTSQAKSAAMKKENQALLLDMFNNLDSKKPVSSSGPSASSWYDENTEQALLKVEGDTPCVFTWRWINPDDKYKSTPQCITDSQQISVLRLITYRQSQNVKGHFKCPFCQLTSTCHVRVSDHVRVDHMDIQRHKCEKCFFRSWFKALVENHRKLQHDTSLPMANESPAPPKESSPFPNDNPLSIKLETSMDPLVQAPMVQEPSKNDCEMSVVTDYRTLYLRTYCPKNKAVMYMCTICSEMLSNQKSFFDHVTNHYGKLYQCTVCSFKTYPRESMETHLKIHRRSLKPSLIALYHEKLIKVEKSPLSEIFPKPVMDQVFPKPVMVSSPSPNEDPIAPSPNEDPIAPIPNEEPVVPAPLDPQIQLSPPPLTVPNSQLARRLTFYCSECPAKSKGLKAFSGHLKNHYKNPFYSTKTLSSSLLADGDPHQMNPASQKYMNFGVCVSLTDMFSYYDDNAFSYYS